jgi:hypothetical protein
VYWCLLLQLLQGQDATVIFEDGSNLLHEVVEWSTSEHCSVLLDHVRGQMTPEDMMAAQPIDYEFINSMVDNKTALYKVRYVGWLMVMFIYCMIDNKTALYKVRYMGWCSMKVAAHCLWTG